MGRITMLIDMKKPEIDPDMDALLDVLQGLFDEAQPCSTRKGRLLTAIGLAEAVKRTLERAKRHSQEN